MNARFSLAAFVPALLAVAACNAADPPKNGAIANVARAAPAPPATKASGNAAQPANARLDEMEFADPAPAKADPAQVTRAWFAGRWSDTGDCADAGAFVGNGTYHLADGTRGMWSVQDGKLFVQHAGGRTAIRIRKVDERTVEIVNEDGTAGRSIRC